MGISKLALLQLVIPVLLFPGCLSNKKTTQKNSVKPLPVFFELIGENNLSRSEIKEFSSSISASLKKRNIDVITKEQATKLLQNEMQEVFESLKRRNLNYDKYVKEGAKAMNQIPSVSRKLTLKFFNISDKIDSAYIISVLYPGVFEKKRPDSLSLINSRGIVHDAFINEVIDSCFKRNIIR